jgi:hypothetical protein
MTRTREENAADLAREEQWLQSLVPVYVAVTGEPTDHDDKAVPGVYLVEVEPDLTPEERTETALDIFHENCGISSLEDFTIVVYSAAGDLLPCMEDHEIGSFWAKGRWGDTLTDDRVPSAVKDAMQQKQAPTP